MTINSSLEQERKRCILNRSQSVGIVRDRKSSRFVLASPSAFIEAEDACSLHQRKHRFHCCYRRRFLETRHTEHARDYTKRECTSASLKEDCTPPPLSTSFLQQLLLSVSVKKRWRQFLEEAEGDFSLVIVEPERILALRDPVGVQPFYYGENGDFAALASNRTALWKLGLE